MPVRRLHSLEEAERSVTFHPDDPRLLPTIRTVWALADRMCPRHFPPGLYKHRSILDLNRQSEQWEVEAVRAQRR